VIAYLRNALRAGFKWPTTALFIPVPLEDARFRKSERFIIKAPFFIKGYSLKKKGNAKYGLPSLPQVAGLEILYAALMISTRTLHGCSLLENAGAYSPE
jgi:hypothetical protein